MTTRSQLTILYQGFELQALGHWHFAGHSAHCYLALKHVFSHTWCWSPMKSAWSGQTCETSKICVFFVNLYPKTWWKHDANLTCAYFSLMAWLKSPAFFGVVENWAKFSYTWHILKLVKYPIGSMGLVYCTYLHFPKKINHPWISIYRYRRPMDPSWDVYYSCLCLCYML